MKIEKVIGLIKTKDISNPQDALRAGLTLKYLGDGAYRHAYHVVGTNLIIKFANNNAQALSHSVKEYKSVLNILKSTDTKLAPIKKHLPKIYWCDETKGITVAQRYKMLPRSSSRKRAALQEKLSAVLKGAFDINNSGNVGVDGRGTLKVIDSGFLSI